MLNQFIHISHALPVERIKCSNNENTVLNI